jgi:lysylphosphatidylglycerol synthetase-like protein (DUF2156 family)
MRLISPLVILLLLAFAVPPVGGGDVNLLDQMDPQGAVQLPQAPGPLLTVGGPIALGFLFFGILLLNKLLVPFRGSREDLTLYHYPTGVKRGLALALVLYGVAFLVGASEIPYQIHLHGSSREYFRQMSLGKLIAFTHAHLFGFTTEFVVIGVPFSMQFNHLAPYQWIFPIGLAACLIDVLSWWGIKYVDQSFVVVSILCGIVFSSSYLYMLVGLLRVLLFPQVIWKSDRDWRERKARRESSRTDV